MLNPRLRRCLDGGTSVLVGTVDSQGMPSCCRAIAIKTDDDLKTATVYVPMATSQRILLDIATTHRLAVVATLIVEHVSVQLKGTAINARLARDDEATFVEDRLQMFEDVLHGVGVPRRLTRSIAHWPVFIVDMRVEEVFEQTPGPNAGTRLQ
jgi:hypothetical protein